MKQLTQEIFNEMLEHSNVKARLKSELRFVTSTAHLNDEDWDLLELVAITDRSGNKGVLVISFDDQTYILSCEFKQGMTSASTGRGQPIICDFCATWQSGNRSGNIVFTKVKKGTANVGYLCCGDLLCSKHVRTLTSASKISRAQLREDMNNDQRVERLKDRLRKIISDLQVEPIQLQ